MLTTGIVNDAPYVRRAPNVGISGNEEQMVPPESFMVVEVRGKWMCFKMSAAVLEMKPEGIRHTVLTQAQLHESVENTPMYIQRFVLEGRAEAQRMGQISYPKSNTKGERIGTQTQNTPRERPRPNRSFNKGVTRRQSQEAPATQSKKAINDTGSTHSRNRGRQGTGNFEYRIKYDIVPTDDMYMIPPQTMASGDVPSMEAVFGGTTVRFSQVGVTKVFLPPRPDP